MAREPEQRVVHIVDADASVRQALSRLVRAAGFEARMFAKIDDLLAARPCVMAGCILLDITRPSACTAGLQTDLHEHGMDLPVIALSARRDAATRRWARTIGSQLLLCKPVDDQALLDAIEWVSETGQEGSRSKWIAVAAEQPYRRHVRHRRPR